METSLTLARKIQNLRKSLRISQTELAARLGVSAMVISRMERGQTQPSGKTLIRLGVLSKHEPALCWSFWNEAGLSSRHIVDVLPIAAKRLRRTIPIFRFVNAGGGRRQETRQNTTEESLIAIPFLQLTAAAGKEQGSSNHDLTNARTEHFIAGPKLWCPNPNHTICMRVKGSSMEPTLFDGYIIVIDQQQNQKAKLNKQIIVAHHDKFGLVVSRFWQLKNSPALVSDNRKYDPEPFSASWSIVGKVLWWIGEAPRLESV